MFKYVMRLLKSCTILICLFKRYLYKLKLLLQTMYGSFMFYKTVDNARRVYVNSVAVVLFTSLFLSFTFIIGMKKAPTN
jgi:hypothetical protein